MAIPPVTTRIFPLDYDPLPGRFPPAGGKVFMRDFLDWLGTAAETPEERSWIDRVAEGVLRGMGAVDAAGYLDLRMLVQQLFDVVPNDAFRQDRPTGESVDILKSLLGRAIARKRERSMDKILYLLRVLFPRRDELEDPRWIGTKSGTGTAGGKW